MSCKTKYPVFGEYEVVVIGGGTAGFAASIASARTGARTLVIEEQAFLGGMSTGGMISQFMGFTNSEDEPLKGIVGEMLDRMAALNSTTGVETIYLGGRKDADVKAAPYNSEVLKYVMDEMVVESGAEILFHTKVIDVFTEGSDIAGILISKDGAEQIVRSKVYIDATFHGYIGIKAGIPLQPDFNINDLQPASLMFKMANVDEQSFGSLTKDEKNALAKKGISEGNLFIDNVLARPLGRGVFYHNMSRLCANPLDSTEWSKNEIQGRNQVSKISRFLIENVRGFENAILVSMGSFLGLRDSRRLLGKYTLTGKDIMKGTKFQDSVVSSSYPVDIHDATGFGYTFVKPDSGVFYIPFRCMIGEINNLMFTGRCISADKDAHGSVRVMVTCMRLGEAAGIASADSIKSGTDINKYDGTLLYKNLL